MVAKTETWVTNFLGSIWLLDALTHRVEQRPIPGTETSNAKHRREIAKLRERPGYKPDLAQSRLNIPKAEPEPARFLEKQLNSEAYKSLFPGKDEKPGNRTIQTIYKALRDRFGDFLDSNRSGAVNILAGDTLLRGDDLAYVIALQRLSSNFISSTFTQNELEIAFELKDSFGWPHHFDEHSGPSTRTMWTLPDPFGVTEVPGEIAIIKELSLRRSFGDSGTNVSRRYDDIHAVLLRMPWARPERTLLPATYSFKPTVEGPHIASTLWEGLGEYSVLDIYPKIAALASAAEELYFNAPPTKDVPEELRSCKSVWLAFEDRCLELEKLLGSLCPPAKNILNERPGGIWEFNDSFDNNPITRTWETCLQVLAGVKEMRQHRSLPDKLDRSKLNSFEYLCSLLPQEGCCDADWPVLEAEKEGIDLFSDAHVAWLSDKEGDRFKDGFGFWCDFCQSRSFKNSDWRSWLKEYAILE